MDQEQLQFYTTQRPIDLGTFPKLRTTRRLPSSIIMSVSRDHERFSMGRADLRKPADRPAGMDYELRPAPGNPDIRRT
jgi:hypothetical protein